MSKNEPKSLSELLGASKSELGHIAERAQLHDDLSDHLRKSLPAELQAGFLHCSLQGDATLVVAASSPEWAARLRFESNQILAICRSAGLTVEAVRVRTSTG